MALSVFRTHYYTFGIDGVGARGIGGKAGTVGKTNLGIFGTDGIEIAGIDGICKKVTIPGTFGTFGNDGIQGIFGIDGIGILGRRGVNMVGRGKLALIRGRTSPEIDGALGRLGTDGIVGVIILNRRI